MSIITAMMDFIRTEVAAGQPFPTAARIADHLDRSDTVVQDLLIQAAAQRLIVLVSRTPSGWGWRYRWRLPEPEPSAPSPDEEPQP